MLVSKRKLPSIVHILTTELGAVAKAFGPYGGDVGIFMAFAISCLVYPPLRWYERRMTGR